MDSIVRDLKGKADKELKDKKYKEAVHTYSCALACPSIEWLAFPKLKTEICCKRAECYFKLEDFTKVIEDSVTAVIALQELDTNNEDLACALYLQANAFLSTNALFDALLPAVWLTYLKPKAKKVVTTTRHLKERLQSLFMKDKTNEDRALHILMDCGISEFERENTQFAFHIFTETIELLDRLFVPSTHLYRARCFLKMGQLQDAHEDCLKVLIHAPRDDARQLMKEIQDRMGKQTEKPEEKHLDEVEMMLHLKSEADKRLKDKKYAEALGMYTSILQLPGLYLWSAFPDVVTKVICKKAECHIKLGQFVKAIDDSQWAMDVSGDDHLVVALYLHMKALEGAGRLIEAYKDAIYLSYLKHKDSKIVTATQQLRKKLLDLFKQGNESKDEALNQLMTLGMRTFHMGKSELASLIFTETINLSHPKFLVVAHLCRARCFMEMGQLDDADGDCSKVLCEHSSIKEAVEMKKKIQRLKQQRPFKTNKESAQKDNAIKGAESSILTAAEMDVQRSSRLELSTDSCGVVSEMENYELENEITKESAVVHDIDVTGTEKVLGIVDPVEDKENSDVFAVPHIKNTELDEESGTEKTKKTTKKNKKKKETKPNKEMKETEGRDIREDNQNLQATKKKKEKIETKLNKEMKETEGRDIREEMKETEGRDIREDNHHLQKQEDYKKCTDSLDDDEVKSKNSKKKKKKKKHTKQQGDGTTPSNDRPFNDTCSQGTLRAASSVSNLSVASLRETDAASSAWSPKDPRLKVYIMCEHFFRENLRRHASQLSPFKYCKDCENLLYAFWCRKKVQWQILRPYPKGVRGPFQQCKHYLINRPCGRTPCTFAHGVEEIEIWKTQRKRGDTRSHPSSTDDLFVESFSMSSLRTSCSVNDLTEIPKEETSNSWKHKDRDTEWKRQIPPNGTCTPTVDQTNVSQITTPGGKDDTWTVVRSRKTNEEKRWRPVQSSSTLGRADVAAMVQKQNRVSHTPAVPATLTSQRHHQYSPLSQGVCNNGPSPVYPPTSSPSQNGYTDITKSVSEIENKKMTHSSKGSFSMVVTHVGPTANSTLKSRPLHSSDFPALGSSSHGAPTASVLGPAQSAWSSGAPKIQSSLPSKAMVGLADVQHPTNSARELPRGVYIVCAHFLEKYKTRSASVYERNKVCKGCENRSKVHYALWCNRMKTWKLPRPLPAEVKAAFQLCKHFTMGERCRKEPCTFAHGQEELLTWTMERKGVLQSPSDRFQAQIAKRGGRLTMQHLKQYKHRPPPPRFFSGAYRMCKCVNAGAVCRYGRACLFAHGVDELNAWNEQDKSKQKQTTNENSNEQAAVNCMEEIMREPESERADSVEGITIQCTPPQRNVTLSNDGDQHTWTFCLEYKPAEIGHLRHVLLLHLYHHCYKLKEIRVGHYEDKQSYEMYIEDFTAKLDDISYKAPPHKIEGRAKIDVTVAFSAPVFGTFAQCLLFDFGTKPYLVQRLNVDVCSEDDSGKLMAARHELGMELQRWDENTIEVVRVVSAETAALQEDRHLKRYSLPGRLQNIVSAQVMMTRVAVQDDYKRNMHQLLFIEETCMNQEISRYCLQGASLHAQRSVFDEITGMRWAADGELYGILHLALSITPDDTAGRLFLRNVCAVWIKPAVTEDTPIKRVYEAKVEKVENDSVVLKLTSGICSDFQLYDTCDAQVDAQFQLNRGPLCEMHAAIDNLGRGQLRLIFPDPATCQITRPEFHIRCNWLLDSRLNETQKEIIKAILSPGRNYPPLVVFGPFGTGKTFTLSQAVRQLVQDRSNRVLLCTHSNKAADIHVELLDDYLVHENGIQAAKPLRVYQPMRKFTATSEKARKYCLLNNGEFVLPSRQDVIRHHVVITTLFTSRVLLDLQLHHGIFTHILVDEAAQALEPEAVIPLALAGPNTKIVLTGDHMQMSPDVYSRHAKDWGLQRSLPERLFDHYEATQDEVFMNANVMFLRENYRSHEEILNFPSENFYGGKLIARGHGDQPAHPRLGPLVFYTARGIEQMDQDHSFVNLSEVSEVVKRVEELDGDWPTNEWGEKDLSQIAVLSAYRFQVKAIRNQLKHKALRDVTVDTIHNVQGQQFRAVFISTVRTLNTCMKNSRTTSESADTYYLEFLSDPKLLNTAVTRARSLVAVIGDPISLCTIGHCRGLWRDYIKRCNDSCSLHGTTMHELDKEIIESVKSIPLNPDAVSFTPRSDEARDQEHPTEESTAEIVLEREQHSPELERNGENSTVTVRADDSKDMEIDDKIEKGSESSSDEDDSDDDLDSLSYEDFQGENLEDATVFPRYMDEIIKALVSKCEETLRKNSLRKSLFQESEFPLLQQANSTSKAKQPRHPTFQPTATSAVELAERCTGDYEMVVINGRVEIRLVNLGFQITPSAHARRLLVSTREQECLQPEVLRRLLHDEPTRYLACILRLNPDRGCLAYAEIQDTNTPDIEITGRVRQAFDRDTVVIELIPGKDSIQGKIVGTLEHIISPHERQYVCTVDYNNPSLLRPLNKSVTKLVNMSHKQCEDMPIYKKEHNKQITKVTMFKRKKVMSGKYLFVVQYLQWRPDCTHPLGIVVKALPKGDTAQDSLAIAYSEYGVRKTFQGATKETRERFPTSWSIPANEYLTRRKVSTAFTIDPPDSGDLDDALSVETTPDFYRVGIHIADVSYFVQPGSALDEETTLRCTSYYPGHGQESIPMIPRELSEGHCSLLPDQDRLAVSLFLCLNNEGEVVGQPVIHRTIVHSCCRLTYSQAQKIISRQKLEREFPQDAVIGVRILNTIAQSMRRMRLGDGSDVGHDGDVKVDTEAHELVQEMMILANKTIAEYLVSNIPDLAPLRTQLPPKKHRMTEWLQKYGKYLQYLQANHRCMNVAIPEPEQVAEIVKIHKGAWSDICKAAEERNMAELTRLLCDEGNQPQLTTAHGQFRRMQARAQYVCAGDQPEENIIHYSLGVPKYTHFTSPIRRYADILVHRLVLQILAKKNVDEGISRKEIARICRRCTFYQGNSRKFGKACSKIHLAEQLKKANLEICVIVESIEEGRLSLHIAATEYDLLGGREKKLKISLLNPIDTSHPEVKGTQCIELKLRFRMYHAPTTAAPSSRESRECKDGQNDELIPSSEVKAMLSDDLTDAYNPVDIPGGKWLEMLDAVKSGDAAHLSMLINNLVMDLHTARPCTDARARHTLEHANRKGDIYQHPHQGEKAGGTENDGHFYDKILRVKQYDPLHVQLTCHTIKGLLSPDIQLLKLTSQVNVCLEHQKYPCKCFATTAFHNASQVRYDSIEDYIKSWSPVLAMEAATQAVAENDSFTITKLGVSWEIDGGKTVGHATLPVHYCTSRQTEFYLGDLICIRVRYEDCEGQCPKGDSNGELADENKSARAENIPIVDASMRHPENNLSSRDETNKNVTYTRNPKDYWVGHCVLEKTLEKKELQVLEFRLHQTSSDFPRGLYDGRQHASTFEMIHRTLPQRRMYGALCLLPDSSSLVHAICEGQEPKKEEDFGKPPLQLSLSQHYPRSKFKELNLYQEKAVKEALANPLTLIQGPPGTGKTVTGVHIAYWFAQRNKTLRPKDIIASDEDLEMEAPKAPPQLIYCGPSNKSVDVVAEYLLRETDLKILRVCSSRYEQKEFPIPNKLKPVRETCSPEEMILSPAVREVSLHHVIRAPDSPFAHKLKETEEAFQADKRKGERTSNQSVGEYRKLISTAETWAIQETGVQIILCTCVVAGCPRIRTACDNIMQCIVDECGMSMELETLIPILCPNTKQIILIGDHKQLQPVIQDNVAKNLGLQVSMFERLSKRAMLLQRQYRMHEAICDFPSQQFYDGRLETDGSVKSRGRGPVDWWPAQRLHQKDWPVVFCHVEGKEESTVFKTAQSNEQSKSNIKEVDKAVHVAKHLVNKYFIDKKNVVILSPYRDQRSKITEKLRGAYEEIEVTTFTKSQGSEWDYVILSLVRSLPEHEIDPDPSMYWLREHLGFITDHHQINVALTRARRGMCIIGNKHLLGVESMWGALLDQYEKHECVVDESWPWT